MSSFNVIRYNYLMYQENQFRYRNLRYKLKTKVRNEAYLLTGFAVGGCLMIAFFRPLFPPQEICLYIKFNLFASAPPPRAAHHRHPE
jgi:hypothetical protein